jgi:gamma-glutamyltranspeptidase / glutathione hydrolase
VRALLIPILLAGLAAPAILSSQTRVRAFGSAPRQGDRMSGMVSTAHPLATDAGIDTLKAGGNAFDAALAIAAALNVVEPAMSGMGGYGTILVWDAKEEQVRYLNAAGRIPAQAKADAFRPPTPDYLANRTGAKAVSTPGNLHAWEALVRLGGRLNYAKALEPAIRLAEQGFVLDAAGAAVIAGAFNDFPEHARRIFGKEGKPLAAGDRLVQRDLARSLQAVVQHGPAPFYGGEIGEKIDQAMRQANGFLTLADLKKDRAEWMNPIHIEYRGYEVYTAAPPANAFDALVRLGMMSRSNSRMLGHNSVAYLHQFAEITKRGFAVRLRYAGDPGAAKTPLDELLSEAYWDREIAGIDPARAKPFEPPPPPSGKDRHTTHFVVADKWGNIVSATQTLGSTFGSRIMPEGTGIWLNNSLSFSTFEPKGNRMDVFPGRRKLSGDCPTIVLRNGRPWAALGSPGGHAIGQIVPQIVMNLIDFGMPIDEAIAAPRISFVEPDVLAVEEAVPADVRAALAAMGHNVRVVRALGNAQGLTVAYDSDGNPATFRGGTDPRGAGAARGY